MVQAHALFRPMYQKPPQDSDLSDVDDPIEDPDYHPIQEEAVLLSPWMKMMLPQQPHPPQSRHLYLYSAFNNTICVKATSQYQNSVSIM